MCSMQQCQDPNAKRECMAHMALHKTYQTHAHTYLFHITQSTEQSLQDNTFFWGKNENATC